MSDKKNIALFIICGFASILVSACAPYPPDEKIVSEARKLAISDFSNHEIRFYSRPDSLFQREQYVKNYFNNLNMNAEFLCVGYCGNASEDDVHYMELRSSAYDLKMDSILSYNYGKDIHQKIKKYCDSALLFDKQKLSETCE